MSIKQKVFLVIPTIRNLNFLRAWQKQFASLDHQKIELSIIVCEDHPQKTISLPSKKTFANKIPALKSFYHYSWQEIDADLKKNAWIIPRKVSGIRNYGFIRAYQLKADIIITIDDDCYPVKNHQLITQHLQNLSLSTPKNWTNTYPDYRHMFTRGMPYLNRADQKVMLSHGLWTNVLDHDGATHLQHLQFKAKFAEHFLQIIPRGAFYPMCSMNMAFDAKITPLMYFPLMGEDQTGNKWGYDRFDDIWAGLFSKKIMDHLGLGVVNGAPFVKHKKASDPFKNLQKEARGVETNEKLAEFLQTAKLSNKQQGMADCYKKILDQLMKTDLGKEEYFQKLNEAIRIWLEMVGSR